MGVIIYSNCLGSFVFDNNLHIKEKVLFKDKEESIKNCLLLEKGETVEIEKKLVAKYHSEPSKDMKRLLNFFKDQKYLIEIRKISLDVTKRKVRNAVKKDAFVIQAINSIGELNKVANLLIKRLREWYELYNPELSHSIEDNEKFVDRVIEKPGPKVKQSMGADFAENDMKRVTELAKQIKELYGLREKETKYLENVMKSFCPNLNTVAGSLVGAKLISLAGGLHKLIILPASTVQMLGAEKALFRHMKNKKSLPPKYGELFNHPLVQKTKKAEKGKVARALANKISLAAKIDFFNGKFIGDRLLKEVMEKIK